MFNYLEAKILGAVGIAVAIGVFAMMAFLTAHHEQNILRQNSRMMERLTQSVDEALQATMVEGVGHLGGDVTEHLADIPGVTDFRVLRLDGKAAFTNDETIKGVNTRLGEEQFETHEQAGHSAEHGQAASEIHILSPEDPRLREALTTEKTVSYFEWTKEGQAQLTHLAPIENTSDCESCHGDENPLRGLIKLTVPLDTVTAEISAARKQSGVIGVAAAVFILGLTGVLLRRFVVRPVRAVTDAMRRASEGDLSLEVPVTGRDEIGEMAESFNEMIRILLSNYNALRQEQDKLTTIILSAREGIVVTDKSGNVVLVNPAAERLLGKSMAKIVEDGFSVLLGDPVLVKKTLEESEAHGPRSLMMEFGGHTLEVMLSVIHGDHGDVVGKGALIRDVTEEKSLEEKLRQLSTIDGLTELYNRRYMDEALEDEVRRAGRNGQPVSVLMYDVDHFKRFNDEHGHEQGDEVLRVMARETRVGIREVDKPCRYGGEEFVLVLPHTDPDGALITAERLRQRVEAAVVDGLKVTISVGVATYPGGGIQTANDLVKAADAALYMAKDAGRNCVRVAAVS